MKKLKFFTNAQKEEKWLNDMLQKGWQLTDVNVLNVYTFKQTAHTQQIIRLDCQSFNSALQFQDYKALYEDFGWVHVGGSRMSLLQYWLQPDAQDATLFSDKDSQKHYLQRLSQLYGSYALFCLFLTFCLFKNASQFVSIKDAYFTPGLWDKTGTDFFTAFAFETPFALMRFGSPWLMLIFGAVAFNSYWKYKKKMEETV